MTSELFSVFTIFIRSFFLSVLPSSQPASCSLIHWVTYSLIRSSYTHDMITQCVFVGPPSLPPKSQERQCVKSRSFLDKTSPKPPVSRNPKGIGKSIWIMFLSALNREGIQHGTDKWIEVKEPNKFHNYETEKITHKASDVAAYVKLFGSSTRDRHARCI